MRQPSQGTRTRSARLHAGLSAALLCASELTASVDLSEDLLAQFETDTADASLVQLLAIAWGTGVRLGQVLTARDTDHLLLGPHQPGSAAEAMYARLLEYRELDTYLHDCGIRAR